MTSRETQGVATKARPTTKSPGKFKAAKSSRTVFRVEKTKKSRRHGYAIAPATKTPAKYVVGFLDGNGNVVVARVAQDFRMSKGQLAETVGLSPEALYKVKRTYAPKTQNRMREMLEIVARVLDWAGGKDQAMAWYRAEPIPAFGGRTAESIVKTGQATALRDYLDALAMGSFA